MKKNVLTLSILILSIWHNYTIAQTPIPNYSFENWTLGEPDNWQTSNGTTTFITQVTPGHTGSYAVRGDVQDVFGFIFPPLLASEDTGFAVTQGYSTLYFFYKFNQVNGASLYVTVNFYDATNASAGFGVSSITTSASDFTLGSTEITLTGTPVRCFITATIFDLSGSPSLGNYFILDDFSFDVPIGIPSVGGSDYYIDPPVPNPATTYTTISYSIPKPSALNLKIFDLLGRQVSLIQVNNANAGENLLHLDTRDVSDGTYILVMISDFGMLQRRIVVEH